MRALLPSGWLLRLAGDRFGPAPRVVMAVQKPFAGHRHSANKKDSRKPNQDGDKYGDNVQ
jgi:hypothetical protein